MRPFDSGVILETNQATQVEKKQRKLTQNVNKKAVSFSAF